MKKRRKRMDRIWQAGLVFALLLLLCGCTRKEELFLLSEEKAEGLGGLSKVPGEEGYPAVETGRVPEDADQCTAEGESRGEEMTSGSDSLQRNISTAPGVIYVHVCGAVVHPGVYELKVGSRVYEAVGLAGGFAEDADQNYVNQAQTLEDGVMLVIPTQEESADARDRETDSEAETMQEGAPEKIGIVQDRTAEGLGIVGGTSQDGQGGDKAGASDGRININTASEAQLCEIPGVGATRAAAIAAYRESHGFFEKPEDIMKVNGIKEGMYEKIKDSISVK